MTVPGVIVSWAPSGRNAWEVVEVAAQQRSGIDPVSIAEDWFFRSEVIFRGRNERENCLVP